jgi:cytochrome c
VLLLQPANDSNVEAIMAGAPRPSSALRLGVAAVALALIAGLAGAQTLPAGDPAKGATIFKKCAACHKVGPGAKNAVGPALNGIVGRPAGTYPGFNYSDANKHSGVVWDEATLAAYLPSPKKFILGTKMTFVGLPDPRDVADVIAFLKQFDADGNKMPPQP